jgi:hypothetical protein
MSNALDPKPWVNVASTRRPKLPHTTEWFDGTTAPTRPGWYERHFTDSMVIGDATMQYWDGEFWRNRPHGTAHWRQVGDYPAWRGLAEPPQPRLHDNDFALAA